MEKRELEAARLKAAKVATLLEAARALRHEINNPVGRYLWPCPDVEREPGEPKVAQRLKVIIKSCERIARVIQRLSSIVEPVATFQPGSDRC